MMKKISAFKHTVKSLANGEHEAMHASIVNKLDIVLPTIGITKMTTLATAYKGHYNHEAMIIKTEQPFDETPLIRIADDKRDEAISVIENVITNYAALKVASPKQVAAKSLMHIVTNFKRLKARRQQDETGLIRAMLADLDTPESKAALIILDLQDVVESLRVANQQFDELWHKRLISEHDRMKHGTLKESRIKTDESLVELGEYLEAMYNAEMTGTFVLGLIGELIDFINIEIKGAVEILSRRNIKNKPHKPRPGEDPDGGMTLPEDENEGGIG